MDPTLFEVLKNNMESMQETLVNLRNDMQDQREAHRNEIATLHHHITEVQREQATRQRTPHHCWKM